MDCSGRAVSVLFVLGSTADTHHASVPEAMEEYRMFST